MLDGCPGSSRDTRSCSTGSTAGSKGGRDDVGGALGRDRADAGAVPGRGGLRRARRRPQSSTRSTVRVSRRCCCCRHGRSSTRATGRCRSPTSRGTAAWSRSTGAGTAAPTAPRSADAYDEREFAADALAVMDATATDRAVVVVVLARRGNDALLLAAEHPERVDRMPSSSPRPYRFPGGHAAAEGDSLRLRASRVDEFEGWAKCNRYYWLRDYYADFLEFFFSKCFTEPHSTKRCEDAVGWGLETDAETLIATQLAQRLDDEAGVRALLSSVRLPGARDPRQRRRDPTMCIGCAAARSSTGGIADRPRRVGPRAARPRSGQGQSAPARLHRPARRRPRRWVRGKSRPQARALHLLADRARPCSARRRDRGRAAQAPSGSRDRLAGPAPGHRSARGTRGAHPSGERATWPTSRATSRASPPSTTCTASRRSAAWTRSCSPTSWSSTTSSRDEQYDLWIGDEAWELDYYLHENPEQKRAPYVWLTDFVGWLPMADGGDHEAFLTGDYNEEMIEHIARFPRVRDQAVFVGNPDDIVPERFASAPALDPRVDRGALRLRRLRHGLRSGGVRRPGRAQSRARLRRGRAGLHRHRRRLGRRRRPPAASDRRLPGGEGAGAGPADDRRRRAADRPGDAARSTTGSRSAPTSTSSTATWPPATSRSSRAA